MSARRFLPLFAAMLLTAPAPAGAAADDFDLRVGVEVRYDDNVFEYGEGDRELFDPTLERYRGLGSVDDWIVAPQARGEYRWRGAYDTRVAVGVTGAFYESNRVKDYQSYFARVSQELPYDAEITLRASLVPSWFLKRLADPPNQGDTYADATFRIATLKATLGKRLGESLELEGWCELERDDYTPAFDERDITKLGGGLDILASPARWVQVRAGAGLGEGVARGENDPLTDSDLSYTLWTAELSALFRVTDRLTLTAGYSREGKHFTTGLIHDRSHDGRDDVTDVFEVGLRVRLARGTTVAVGVERTNTRADRDGDRLGFASFTDNLYKAQVSYEF